MEAISRDEYYEFQINVWSAICDVSENLAKTRILLSELQAENARLRSEVFELKAIEAKFLN